MDIEIIVGPLLALFIFSLFGLSYNRLRRWLGKDISVKPIYLRSSGDHQLLQLKISNVSGCEVTVNNISLLEVNGKGVREIGNTRPFKIEDKKHAFKTITFEGEVREKNDINVILAVESFKGRRVLKKRFSVYLNKD